MRLLPSPYDELRREVGASDLVTAGVILGLWMVPGLLAAAETVAFWRLGQQTYASWRALAFQIPGWLSFAVMTPVMLWVGERIRGAALPRLASLSLHLAAALVLGSAYALSAAVAGRFFSPFSGDLTFGRLLLSWYLSGLPVMVLSYVLVLGAGRALFWFAEHQRGQAVAEGLRADLSEARLSSLRMQLHPHFLFNSLNAVSVLVRDGKAGRADQVLALLSGLLRETLQNRREQLVPLEEEVDFIRRYLAVEAVRFSDRLRVSIDIPGELAAVPVPSLILQPLVENAIRHGVSRRTAAGAIRVTAKEEGGMLVLSVEDDGPGPSPVGADDAGRPASDRNESVGLANTRARLALLYGSHAECVLERRPEGGARAILRIPREAHG